jgi:hypothetical protein
VFDDKMEAGQQPASFPFTLIPSHDPDMVLDNVRYALSLGLPDVKECGAHDGVLSVAGGGPSLDDTWKQLDGYVAAVNGSLSYLIERGVTPQLCGVCDPRPHLSKIVAAEPGVTYFLASCVHRSVFDKLLAKGCQVYLWHLSPIEGQEAILKEHYPDGYVQIPGGSTMGGRWLTLGYHLGFRKFHFHGMDSSFRGKSSHAYPDAQDDKEWVNFDGYQTRVNFITQVEDFISMLNNSLGPDVEPIDVQMHGDGLLQYRYHHWMRSELEKFIPATADRSLFQICEKSPAFPDWYRVAKRGSLSLYVYGGTHA